MNGMLRPGERLGEFEIVRELSTGSFLAENEGGRKVVIKALQPDCLLEGQLHPSIRLRLTRVGQLPTRRVANLHGVVSDRGIMYLIWDYVPGRTMADLPDRRRFARELRAAVESMHSWGIVHGAIHENNVIVDDRGTVVLTHVSPLLFNDEQRDWRAVATLVPPEVQHVAAAQTQAQVRWRSLLWAMIAIVGGIIVALAMAHFAGQAA
jgi:hypothetical protein